MGLRIKLKSNRFLERFVCQFVCSYVCLFVSMFVNSPSPFSAIFRH